MYVQIKKMHNYLIKLPYKINTVELLVSGHPRGAEKVSITSAGLLRDGSPKWPIVM